MKIIIVATTPFFTERGTHIRILNEAISVAKAGHFVEIITYPIGKNPKECVENNIKITRISNVFPWYTKTSAGPSFAKVFFDIVLSFKLFFRVLSEKPDILYAHNHEAVIASFLVQKILFWRRIRTVGDFHGGLVSEMIIYKGIKYSVVKKFFSLIEDAIYKMPDQSIASSRPLTEYISKDILNYETPELSSSRMRGSKLIKLMQHNLDSRRSENDIKNRKKACSVFYDAPSIPFVFHDKKKMREKYAVSQEAFVILYTGGFTKDKGIDVLLSLIRECVFCHSCVGRNPGSNASLRRVRHSFSEGGSTERRGNPGSTNIFWIIAGDPLEALQIPADISSHIKIVSPLDPTTLGELLSLADSAIDPKEQNSLQASGKIINYMQYGLPVFCFDNAISRDYFGDELADKLTGKNLDLLQKKILYFLKHKDECVIMKDTMQNRVKLFSWNNIVDILK